MTTLSNYQVNDSSQDDAWNETTFVIGALTGLAIVAILFFASTA